MKKICLLLLLAGLLLSACGVPSQDAPMVQPVSFFYRTAETDFSAEDGVIRAEVRDLGSKSYTDLELFQLYLEGPMSRDLISPVSQGTVLSGARRYGGTLELRLTRGAYSPTEFDHALTYACLAKTGLALDGINKVQIYVRTQGGRLLDSILLTESDILLYDNGTASDNEITLYYADEAESLLLTEKRTLPRTDQEDLVMEVLKALVSGPQSGGMRSPLPPGTGFTEALVEDGLCKVDCNSDFGAIPPDNEQAAQLSVLSVVNTLCELDGINSVEFYIQGQKLDSYGGMDLTEPLVLESALIGPIHQELGEFSGVLCLPGQQDGLLHRLNVRTKARGGSSKAEALLQALFSRTAQNGFAAPFSGKSFPFSVITERYVCTVVFYPGTLPVEEPARTLALRSVTATLCTIPEIESVVLWEDGENVSLRTAVTEDWFYPGIR